MSKNTERDRQQAQVHEFNKVEPTYRATMTSDGGVSVSLKRGGEVLFYEDFDDFANWAFEGGDSV